MKMKYLVIHTTDSSFNRNVTADDIELWHKGLSKNKDNTYTYLGKKYPDLTKLEKKIMQLPSGKVVKVVSTNGRGWSQVGYSDLINQKGELINLVPYTFDETIDSSEVTNGATGYNSCSRHVVLAGGWTKEGVNKTGYDLKGNLLLPEMLYTDEALNRLIEYIKLQKTIVPDLIVVGHNELAKKSCPNFDVQLFLKRHNLI